MEIIILDYQKKLISGIEEHLHALKEKTISINSINFDINFFFIKVYLLPNFIYLTLVFFSGQAIAVDDVKSTNINYSKSKSSDDVQRLSKKWDITKEEYIRYIELIEGPLGKWNPDIDPVLALGIFSRNKDEKKRYADLYARQEYNLVVKTQSFERAYRESFSQQFPEAKIISPELMQGYYDHQAKKKNKLIFGKPGDALISNDRLLYFVDVACQHCTGDLEQLHKIINTSPEVYLDIYILGISNEEDARAWAKDNNIDIQLVKDLKITINIDKGTFASLKDRTSASTRFFLSREKDVYAINPMDIILR